MKLLPFELLNGNAFGILDPEDEGSHLLNIEVVGALKRLPQDEKELLMRDMITLAMRRLSGSNDWAYPEEKEFQVGNID